MRIFIGGWRYCKIFHIALLTVFGMALLFSFINAQAAPNLEEYQIQFNTPVPKNGKEALDTYDDRKTTVLKYLACGQEAEFLDAATLKKRDVDGENFENAEDLNEDKLHTVLAKMFVYSDWGRYSSTNNRCEQLTRYPHSIPLNESDSDRRKRENKFNKIPSTIDKEDNVALGIPNMFGKECDGIIVDSEILAGFIPVKYSLTRECLRNQINKYLDQAYIHGIVGTSGNPCLPYPIGLTKGEWDVILKELTRIYYINNKLGINIKLGDRPVLNENVRTKIRDKLLTLYGSPGPEATDIFQCGNQERSTGSPEELADERSWLPSALDDIGNSYGWLHKWLARLAVLGIALAVIAAVLTALVGATIAGAIITSLVHKIIKYQDNRHTQ